MKTLTVPSGKPETTQERTMEPVPRYRVILHNDDVNSMEHIIRSLQRVFKFELQECERIMLEAHFKGLAVCAIEPLEQAELHRDQLTSFSLIVTLEPE